MIDLAPPPVEAAALIPVGVRSLALPGKVTRKSLELPANLSFDEWQEIGRSLNSVEGSVMWWLGDWWAYGEHAYGERASQATGGDDDDAYKFQTLMDSGWVARKFETSRRREVLPWSFHKEVAAQEPVEQDRLLDWAEKTSATQKELRAEVRVAVRAAKKADYNDRIALAKWKPLDGTYRIFYADPPWKYIGLNKADEYGHAERHYDCLDDVQLCDYKPGKSSRTVKEMADKDAVLFMWVTSPLLRRCFAIIEAWGFDYKSSFVWDKVGHVMGHYNSVRHELLLICTRGSCTPDIPKLLDSVQVIERSGKHSEKPEEFYSIIDGMYDHGRKLELFARAVVRDGWDQDGNEAQ